jgi:predicted HTH domain antitoxin
MILQIAEEIGNLLPEPADAAASELIVLELYRQGRISSGKAAELLREGKEDFLRCATSAGIPYFNYTDDELTEEIESATRIARARNL